MRRLPWAFYAALAFVALLAVVVGWVVWDHLAARRLAIATDRLRAEIIVNRVSRPEVPERTVPVPYRQTKDLPKFASSVPLLTQLLIEPQQDLGTLLTPAALTEIRAYLSTHAPLIQELMVGGPWSLGSEWDKDKGRLGWCVGRYCELLMIHAKIAAHEGRPAEAVRCFHAALSLTMAMAAPSSDPYGSTSIPTARRVIAVLRDVFPNLQMSQEELLQLEGGLTPGVYLEEVRRESAHRALNELQTFEQYRGGGWSQNDPWQVRAFLGRASRRGHFTEHLNSRRRCLDAMELPYPEALKELKAIGEDRDGVPSWFSDVYMNPGRQEYEVLESVASLHVEMALARAAIDVEVHRIRTGRLPDKLEPPPLDPITGRPIEYAPEAFWLSSSTGQRWHLRRD